MDRAGGAGPRDPDRLLLRLCRAGASTPPPAEISGWLDPGEDRELLLGAARRHGVLPLVAEALLSSPAALDPVLVSELGDEAAGIAEHNRILAVELMRVVAALAAAGVASLPYKGPALAVSAYSSLALRSFGDLDLLVRPEDVDAASKVLRDEGYRPVPELGPVEGRIARRARHAHAWIRHQQGLFFTYHLELHWALAARWAAIDLDVSALLERAVRVPLLAGTIPCLSPEDALLGLAIHGSAHGWYRMALVCDVDRLVRTQTSLRWQELRARAAELGVERILGVALLLASAQLSTPLPPDVVRWASHDRAAAAEARRLAATLPGTRARTARKGTPDYRRRLALRERWRDRIRMGARLLFEPREADYRWIALPPALAPLYPLLRLVRLAGRGLRSVARAR